MNKKILWGIALIPLLVTAAVLQKFPMTVPMHYNLAGKIDRWGSKYEELIFPVIILLFQGYWHFLLHYHEKKMQSTQDDLVRQEIASNRKVLWVSALGTLLFFNAMQFFILYSAWKATGLLSETGIFSLGTLTGAGVGIIFLITGNLMPKLRKNSLIGLRTPWSMKNDKTWAVSQRAAGKLMMAAGAMILMISLIWDSFWSITAATLACMTVMTAGAVLYSYEAYRQYGKETES